MGIKSSIKFWLHKKIKNLLDYEKMPIRLNSTINLQVGKDSFHNGNLFFRGSKRVKIGSYCSLGRDIKIITSNHNYNYPVLQYNFYFKHFKEKPLGKKNSNPNIEFSVEIGNDVWIGDNVSILPNVKIGHGAIIGTGSVVTKDVESYTIVGGVPAKFIKDRFPVSLKNTLLESQWWEWSDEKIKANKDFFFKNYNQDE